MKAIVSVCALLFVTIGVKASTEVNGTKVLSDTTTAEPSNSTIESTKPQAPTMPPTPSTTLPTTSSSNVSSSLPVVSSTSPASPPVNVTTKPKDTTTSLPLPTNSSISAQPVTKLAAPTTSVPFTIIAPSQSTLEPPKLHHFDSLSFMGGIILTTCIMGISVFAWKFYKVWTDGSYRTL